MADVDQPDVRPKHTNMNKPEYLAFDQIKIKELVTLLNKPKIRRHLMAHELFDIESAETWVEEKLKLNNVKGCKVRGIYLNATLVGWCGIQFENNNYEIAIVLDDKVWGLGKSVFKETMIWAKELGHNEVFINLLHTRPEYKFLKKISKNVFITELYGNKFTTYQLRVK